MRLPERADALQHWAMTSPEVVATRPGTTESAPVRSERRPRVTEILPGLATAAALALVATELGHLAPIVGAPVCAIVGGMLLSGRARRRPRLRTGITFSSRTVLQASIVILGTGLSLRQATTTGWSSLPVLLGTLAVALGGAALLGRLLGIGRDLRTLIGVGTGICGASAIAATDAVIDASEGDVSYAIATIFTFNVAAVLTFPSLGHLLGMTSGSFGMWAGTAVNDMSSVVAAASIFGHGATATAVVVKLTRTLMIIPISLVLAFARQRRAEAGTGQRTSLLAHARRSFPRFVAWFVLAVAINSIGLVPAGAHRILGDAATFMITIALGAIGLSTRPDAIRRAGLRPIMLGALLWVAVASTSLGLQHLTSPTH